MHPINPYALILPRPIHSEGSHLRGGCVEFVAQADPSDPSLMDVDFTIVSAWEAAPNNVQNLDFKIALVRLSVAKLPSLSMFNGPKHPFLA